MVQVDGMALIRAQRGLSAEIARRLGVTPSAVSNWDEVPATRVPAVESVTGIPRHLLRPDLHQPPDRCRCAMPPTKRRGSGVAHKIAAKESKLALNKKGRRGRDVVSTAGTPTVSQPNVTGGR